MWGLRAGIKRLTQFLQFQPKINTSLPNSVWGWHEVVPGPGCSCMSNRANRGAPSPVQIHQELALDTLPLRDLHRHLHTLVGVMPGQCSNSCYLMQCNLLCKCEKDKLCAYTNKQNQISSHKHQLWGGKEKQIIYEHLN